MNYRLQPRMDFIINHKHRLNNTLQLQLLQSDLRIIDDNQKTKPTRSLTLTNFATPFYFAHSFIMFNTLLLDTQQARSLTPYYDIIQRQDTRISAQSGLLPLRHLYYTLSFTRNRSTWAVSLTLDLQKLFIVSFSPDSTSRSTKWMPLAYQPKSNPVIQCYHKTRNFGFLPCVCVSSTICGC